MSVKSTAIQKKKSLHKILFIKKQKPTESLHYLKWVYKLSKSNYLDNRTNNVKATRYIRLCLSGAKYQV